MFVDRGFAETSMRDIAGRLGVTTAALYYHFENKDDLLVAAVTPALDELEQLINGRTAARRPKVDPRAFLSRYAETVVANQSAIRLINRDPAVAGHPAIGARLHAIEEGAAQRLSTRRGARAKAIAMAALGAVLLPVLTLDSSELSGLNDVLVQGALAVLGG